MRCYIPTKVYVEKDCVKNHREELCALGRKAFIITGRHSAVANGSLADVTAVLDEARIPYAVFNEVEENPSVETVAKAAEIGIKENIDFVIGIGGGSPLDAAKAIAVMCANPRAGADCLYGSEKLGAFPFAAVPTTCGTGAEVTPNAVLTRPALKKKGSMSHHVYADLALVDGKYLASASQKLIVNTAVDALAHLVESRLSRKSDMYNHMFSEYGLLLWAGIVPYLTGEKEMDEEVYAKMMLTSTIAGMAIAQTGTSLPHALSYPLTLSHNVAHGRSCGLFLAAYMEEYAANRPEDVDRILSLLQCKNIRVLDVLLQRLLGPEAIPIPEMEAMADDMAGNAGKLATYPFDIDREGVLRIITKSLNAQ